MEKYFVSTFRGLKNLRASWQTPLRNSSSGNTFLPLLPPLLKRHINLLHVFMAAFTSCIETVHLEIWFKHSKSPEFSPSH